MSIATPVSHWRSISLLAAVIATGALTTDAAVLPLAEDPLIASRPDIASRPEMAGGRGLQTQSTIAIAGEWVGRTDTGRLVSLVLRIDHGAVVGDATLDGVVSDAKAGPRPLVTPVVSGRRMAFAVRPGPCARSLAHGVVTFVSDAAAELDLHAGSTPITIRLSKVG